MSSHKRLFCDKVNSMLTTKKEKELAFLSLLPKSVRDSDLETFHQTFTGSLFWMKS